MPNWVSNGLTIKGTKSELTEFAEILKHTDTDNGHDKVISFGSTVPIPESELEEWYNWNIQNWGTKWDTHEEECGGINEHKDGKEVYFVLSYGFDTAWSCPTNWIAKTSKDYPSLTFNNVWTEEQGFRGVARFKAGKKLLEESWGLPQIAEFYSWARKTGIELADDLSDEDIYNLEEYSDWYYETTYEYPPHWESF